MILTNKKLVSKFIDTYFESSLKSALQKRAMREREAQDALSGSGDGQGGQLSEEDDDLSGDDSGGDVSVPNLADDKEKLKNATVTLDDVTDRINTIRAGKSLRDPKISAAMGQYFDNLTKAERVALLAFMKGISQILSGEVAGEEAQEPKSNPADVKMTKKGADDSDTGTSSGKKKVVSIKPNVLKSQSSDEKKSKGEEDTTPPAPITPKKK